MGKHAEAGEADSGGAAHEANADVVGEVVAEGPDAVRNTGFRRCGDDYEVNDEFGAPEHPPWH